MGNCFLYFLFFRKWELLINNIIFGHFLCFREWGFSCVFYVRNLVRNSINIQSVQLSVKEYFKKCHKKKTQSMVNPLSDNLWKLDPFLKLNYLILKHVNFLLYFFTVNQFECLLYLFLIVLNLVLWIRQL